RQSSAVPRTSKRGTSMKLSQSLVSACSSLLLVAGLAQQAFAQADIPRTASGKPDLNGVWEFPYVPSMAAKGNGRNSIGPGEVPFTDAGKLNFDRYDSSNGDYTGA